MIASRYERQERFFTTAGQQQIQRTHVCVVGLGGTGSHVVQQLALLGVGELSLIDFDELERTNLNRVIGSRNDDQIPGTYKVEIAKRLVNSIDPAILVNDIRESLLSKAAIDNIIKSSFVFGCVDNDGPRLVLNELCCAYDIPYIDIASEINVEGEIDFGGRIFFNYDENGCLMCYNELDLSEISNFFRNPDQKADIRKTYGIPNEAIHDSGPSVVCINGVVASLGIVEFMSYITKLPRPPNRLLNYRGKKGIVNIGLVQPKPDCYYCKNVRGKKDRIDINKYYPNSDTDTI